MNAYERAFIIETDLIMCGQYGVEEGPHAVVVRERSVQVVRGPRRPPRPRSPCSRARRRARARRPRLAHRERLLRARLHQPSVPVTTHHCKQSTTNVILLIDIYFCILHRFTTITRWPQSHLIQSDDVAHNGGYRSLQNRTV